MHDHCALFDCDLPHTHTPTHICTPLPTWACCCCCSPRLKRVSSSKESAHRVPKRTKHTTYCLQQQLSVVHQPLSSASLVDSGFVKSLSYAFFILFSFAAAYGRVALSLSPSSSFLPLQTHTEATTIFA